MEYQKIRKCAIAGVLLILSLTARAQQADGDSLALQSVASCGQMIPSTQNNKIILFNGGKETFDNIFGEIEKAQHYIHLDYFNFRNDSLGNALFDLLARKAAEGVEVRAVFDAFGNASNNKPLRRRHLRALRARGIEIYPFRPIRFPYVNGFFQRDHHKIVIIDGQIAYTGGINVADYYIHGTARVGEWRDIHVRIEGGAVAEMQRVFLELWNKITDQSIGGERYFPAPSPEHSGHQTVAVVERTPRKTPKQMRCAYIRAIDGAQHSIRIINPYFVPTHSVRQALRRAIGRGVDVEIMISSRSDVPLTPDAAMYVLHDLMQLGAKVWLFEGGFHHSKVMMVDDSFATVGSANLDSRSLRYDHELNVFIFDPAVTAELTEIFEHDRQGSTLLTPALWGQRSCWKKFISWFGNLLTPVL